MYFLFILVYLFIYFLLTCLAYFKRGVDSKLEASGERYEILKGKKEEEFGVKRFRAKCTLRPSVGA